MSQLSDTGRSRPVATTRSFTSEISAANQETLRRVSGLIQLGFGVVNGLIGLRFLLHLMAANPANPFMRMIDLLTLPFLWMFMGLTQTPAFEGISIEFFDLIAIAVYGLLSWVVVRLLWVLFARMR